MKIFLSMLGAISASLQVGAAESQSILNNAFALTGDFAYYKREEGHPHKLIIDNSTTNCNCHYPSCSSRRLVHDFPFEPGFKVAVNYTTARTVWDFSYLWVEAWEGRCGRSSPGSLIFSVKNPGITNDFNGADSAQAEYRSKFQNFALTYNRYMTPRQGNYFTAAYLLGLGYLSLREALDVSFTKASQRSSYQVQTMNHIPTLQVGGLIAWLPTRALTWDLFGKVGVGLDRGEQKTFLGDDQNTVTVRDYQKSGFSTPLVVEGDIRLTYQPSSYFNLHAAYQFIYLNGVALAPDQLVKSNSSQQVYRARGALLIHGLTAGITWGF